MAITLLALATLLSGCSSPQPLPTGESAAAQAITTVAPDARKSMPVLEGEDLTGQRLSSADYSGKVLVVNLWGPWCGPCRAEAPMLKSVAEQYAKQDVQFLGIVVDSDSARASRFNSRFEIGYPSFADQNGKLELGFTKILPTQAVPTTWIVDARGGVAVRIIDSNLTESTLRGLIEDVLHEAV